MPADLTPPAGPQPTTDSESLELPITIGVMVGMLVGLLAITAMGGGSAILVLAVVFMFAATGWLLALMARLLDG
jgi:hypothetical protein